MSIHEEDVLGKAYDARLMRRLLGYLRPYRREVVLASVAIVGHSIIELAPPLLTKLVLDRYIPAGDLTGLARIAAVYLAVLLASFALEYLQTWTMQMAGQRIMFDLRMEIYRHLHRLDVRFFDRNPVGRLMTRVTTDVDALNELFTAGVVSVCGDLVTLAGIMAVLAWMDWRLALVAFSGPAARGSDRPLVPYQRAPVIPDGADLDRPDQRISAGANHRYGDGAAVPT
jgi:ATP-binding cassette subfamily B protein